MIYFIPVPIWNLKDITIRSLETINILNIFFCEDTRTTKSLFFKLNIKYENKKFFSLNSFSDNKRIGFLKDIIVKEDIWILSDAWTPWISDPWKIVVKIANDNNIWFEVLPWPNALIPWIVSAWFDTSEFIFLGFLPTKKWRDKKIKYIVNSDIPVFIYESVHRVLKTLESLQKAWFSWKVYLWKELSKMYNYSYTDNIDNMLSMINQKQIILKWEFVLWFFNYD